MPGSDNPQYRCFIALPFSQISEKVRTATIKGVEKAKFQIVSLDQSPVLPGATIQEAIKGAIASSDCVIADITERNPNIFFELGLAQAMGKGLLLICRDDSHQGIPFDLRELRVIIYKDDPIGLGELSQKIFSSLREYRRFPWRPAVSFDIPQTTPFFIDWDKLNDREIENLCRELLSQMGFQRLAWGKISPEIDLIAELPRKDPDGFEYRELWLVSMGLQAPMRLFLDMVSEPNFFINRILRYSERFDRAYSKGLLESSITILLFDVRKEYESSKLGIIKDRFEKRQMAKNEPFSLNFRLRVWDQNYVTNLIHRFPQIGYKYFADEARIRSKTRMSYEELYKQYSKINASQAKLIAELQEEKNRRIRAERDSVWKDISFSAAHKIGNPIFAIETDLDPLSKRIRENRAGEAEQIVTNIRSAVENQKHILNNLNH